MGGKQSQSFVFLIRDIREIRGLTISPVFPSCLRAFVVKNSKSSSRTTSARLCLRASVVATAFRLPGVLWAVSSWLEICESRVTAVGRTGGGGGRSIGRGFGG